ncbi:peptidase [Segnochrobactrum spirostomi]|uniref:Peptidase n=1 Tax=Segnochrobactrum spirostomi TaxID=2608987 RepID=A0A6A7Y835_9HYPH|nr:peptidase [Segnochrobactrum spirostomi]MQT13649.1 peptidase [Segnochrobactrum spirostomi]
MKPFEIFRAGVHKPLKGDAIAFSESDLASIAAAYDPALHEAPIVVGHPRLDDPAYGWIAGLRVEGDRLVAVPKDVEPAFADIVQRKRFKKVSASFFLPNAPNNPTPGRTQLRHVGFLGATAPAVKGLRPIEFGDASDDDALVLEFADWQTADAIGSIARLFRGLRDYLVSKEGLEAANQTLSPYEIESLAQRAVEVALTPTDPAPPSSFSDSDEDTMKLKTPDPAPAASAPDASAIAAREAEIARREADLAAREAAAAAAARQTRAREDAATVEAAVAAGRLPKGLASAATALFAELGEDTLEFGDGDDAVQTTPRGAFADFLAKLPIPVVTGEIAGRDAASIDFADVASVGPIAEAITAEVDAAAKAGQTITVAEAAARIQKRSQS